MTKGLQIISTGRYLPKKILTNDDLSKMVDTNDDWISARTGIKKRHIADGESNLDMAYFAAFEALQRADIDVAEIGSLIVTTFTPDYMTPSVACLLSKRLGLPEDIPAFDLNAACTGFVYALKVANGLLLQDTRKYSLIVSSEVLSKNVDYSDRSTCILFGDGAGAVIVKKSDSLFFTKLCSSGESENLYCGGHGTQDSLIRMDGGEIFKFAVRVIPKCITSILKKAELTLDDVDWVVCHQANKRIIDSAVKKLGAESEKFYTNVAHYGNTSSASIPIALDEMACSGKLKHGNKIILAGFGAGLTWGSALLEW